MFVFWQAKDNGKAKGNDEWFRVRGIAEVHVNRNEVFTKLQHLGKCVVRTKRTGRGGRRAWLGLIRLLFLLVMSNSRQDNRSEGAVILPLKARRLMNGVFTPFSANGYRESDLVQTSGSDYSFP